MSDFKNSTELQEKLRSLIKTLNEANNSAFKNTAFFSNLTEIGTILEEMNRLAEKYTETNSFKRKFIASDIRHKLKNLLYSLSF